ncbi:hypothetical protein BGZ65_012754, partial [Modicella reniformis]
MKGLEHDTGKEVRLRQPTTLEYAISQATLIYTILFPDDPKAQTPKDGPTPMDLDNMDIRVAINAIASQVNYMQRNGYQGNNKRNHGAPRPSKMTPEEKTYLMANNGCFRCRKLGHMSSQCRTFPSQPQQQQRPLQFNNIEVHPTIHVPTTHEPLQALPRENPTATERRPGLSCFHFPLCPGP